MESNKAQSLKLWYQIFLIIGLLSLIDIATRGLVEQRYGLTDTNIGYVIIGAFFLFRFLFGAQVASIISSWISIVFGFSIAWLILAYFLNQKSKVIANPNEENQKKFKRAKIISLILGGLVLAFVLFAIFLVLF